MTTKTTTSTKTTKTAATKEPVKTDLEEAVTLVPDENKSGPGVASLAVKNSTDGAAAGYAAQEVAREGASKGFDNLVQGRKSRIEQALSEREAVVSEMDGEAEKRYSERDKNRQAKLADEEKLDPAERVQRRALRHDGEVPGTGVADPRDLAPGQSLEPSPPGGVTIAPLPDKPGTPFSKLS